MDNDYILRINQALNYIYQNLDKNLTVDEIAGHCCFSKYYFNRVFKSVTNDSIYSFIKRMKLENAAFKLRTNRRKSITEIALEIGYSPSNFASAFKEYFGISASEFRKYDVPLKNSYYTVVDYIQSLKKQEDFFARIDSKITVKHIEVMYLEYKRFHGNYFEGLGKAWEDFCLAMEQKYTVDKDTLFIGISYDDPLLIDENNCVYDMCIKVPKKTSINTHIVNEGYYACYEFHDRLENLIKSYNEIFALWMPFCKYKLIDRSCIEIYHSGLDAEGKINLDICIPILE